MEPTIQIDRFSDGRLKLRVRFVRSPNFWFLSRDEADWVPSLEFPDRLKDAIQAIDEFNKKKKKEQT